MGVIFCQVIKIKQLNQDNPSETLGNQKWNGTEPIFIYREELIKIKIKLFILKLLLNK